MIKIAILEDSKDDAGRLLSYLEKYQEGKKDHLAFDVQWIENSLSFLEHYKPEFDIIFFDIEMPHLNGMEAAKKIYEIDKNVIIIFVTNLEQYAIQGYKVDALGYLLKPLSYPAFVDVLEKSLRRIANNTRKEILLDTGDKTIRIAVQDLLYVEVYGHTLIYHTTFGNHKTRGKLADCAKELEPLNFVQCHKSYLVNLAHVKSISKNTIMIEEEELMLSRGKNKEFMQSFLSYLSNQES